MTTLMPVDSNSNPIPALRLRDGGAHTIPAASVAARNTQAFDEDTNVVSVYATVPVYLKFGDSEVEATTDDHFYPAGIYYDMSIGDDRSGQFTHLSILRVAQDGEVYVSEKT